MRFPPWSRRWVPWKNLDYARDLYREEHGGSLYWRKVVGIGRRYCLVIVKGEPDA